MLACMRVAGGMQGKPAWPRWKIMAWLVLATTPGIWFPPVVADDSRAPVVFAAASTAVPLGALAQTFERRNNGHVEFSFAASSTLARQIIHGAPPSLFLSANTQWMDQLDQAGLLVKGSRRALLGNRLALIAHSNRETMVDLAQAASLLAALEGTPLVMADPAHVPAGIYTREALESLSLWNPLQGRLAFVASARAVSVQIARGEAPLGITYASELKGQSALQAAAHIPAEAYSPIRYELALVAPDDDPVARAFYEYLFTEEALAVFAEHGFTRGNQDT